jgi:FeS assembly SUF system regulator
MVRMSKLTDYAIVLLALLATEDAGAPHNAREVAARAHLPFPVVSKILKALARAGLLVSHRGAKGGYVLARPAEEISVAAAIRAMEGPIALTECAAGAGHCQQETTCTIRTPWQRVNELVRDHLEQVPLTELIGPLIAQRERLGQELS